MYKRQFLYCLFFDELLVEYVPCLGSPTSKTSEFELNNSLSNSRSYPAKSWTSSMNILEYIFEILLITAPFVFSLHRNTNFESLSE